MKQMTKEELIEYFIEQLGDNEILGQVMSIEQIREKLNYIVKDVTYQDELGNFTGEWVIDENGMGTINFDVKKISLQTEKQIIVHELLHALSTTTVTSRESKGSLKRVKEKCGLHIRHMLYFMDDYGGKSGYGENVAINEGMTDFLAEKITGVINDGYNVEKSIYKVLTLIINQDTLIKKAFVEKVNATEEPLDILKQEFISKYGENMGIELNEQLKRISTLSDQLLALDRNDAIYGIDENGKKLHSQTKEELYSTLYSMVKSVLSRKRDLSNKIDMMIELEKMCDYRDTDLSEIRKLVSKNVLYELLNDDFIDYNQKLEIIEKIKDQGISFSDGAIDEVLFGIEGFPKLSIDEKIGIYTHLQKNKRFTTEKFNRIYQMYVEKGKIIENDFNKKNLVSIVLRDIGIGTVEQINKGLNESRYYKLGEYYALPRGDNPINTVMFDTDGKLLRGEDLLLNPIVDEGMADIRNIRALARHFSEDKVKTIYEQLKERLKQYNLLTKGECADRGITIIGNMIRLYYEDWIEETQTDNYYMDFYSIDDEGNLKLIPQR